MVEEGLVLYGDIFKEMKKQRSQTKIMMYVHSYRVCLPLLPSLPPPQPFPQEDDEDEYHLHFVSSKQSSDHIVSILVCCVCVSFYESLITAQQEL